jgi:hypothetical protein
MRGAQGRKIRVAVWDERRVVWQRIIQRVVVVWADRLSDRLMRAGGSQG